MLGRLRAITSLRLIPKDSPLVSTEDLEPEFLDLYRRCRAFTMTSLPRMYAIYQATKFVVANRTEGSFVECGVWRGGSAMLAALALQQAHDTSRELWLYDTYAGMTEPTEADVDNSLTKAAATWRRLQRPNRNDWCYAPLDEVRRNMASTSYPADKVKFIVGRVEESLPDSAPDRVAILRLDTDWYESTKHELIHLYPRLSTGGILIIDDYGYWRGARKAVDEYFAGVRRPALLHRIDSTGRMMIKAEA